MTGGPVAYWWHRVALGAGTDVAGTDKRIRANAVLTPESLWLVVCSAVLASVGLDQDSAAVIIGAMLISPLMGPILALGLAVGTEDRDLLQQAVRELALATVAALLISTIYFWVSPLAEPTAQIVSRTRPTLLDVGVALFGGIAGIVAGSRRVPSLALPGVAIATALMPPLCAAGFGLATGRPAYFFGALYLFLLNTIFIALATFLVVRWLKFPRHAFVDAIASRRAHRVIAIVVVVASTPSLYFLYRAVADNRAHRRVETFVHDYVAGPNRDVIRWDIVPSDSGRILKVYVSGRAIDQDSLPALSRQLASRGLDDLALQIGQSELSASEVTRLRTDAVQGVLEVLAKNRGPADSAGGRDARVRQASRELAIAFPEIVGVTFAEIPDALAAPGRAAPALLLQFRPGTHRSDVQHVVARARAFIRERLPKDSVDVRER